MLSPRLSQWFIANQEESVRLAGELKECLLTERRALIEWRIQDVIYTTALKEDLACQIKNIRNEMKAELKARAGFESLSELASAINKEMARRWEEISKSWVLEWNEVRNLCETNQQFMEHSQRTMGIILSDWRRLVGDQPRYGAKGEKVENLNTGRMVEKSL